MVIEHLENFSTTGLLTPVVARHTRWVNDHIKSGVGKSTSGYRAQTRFPGKRFAVVTLRESLAVVIEHGQGYRVWNECDGETGKPEDEPSGTEGVRRSLNEIPVNRRRSPTQSVKDLSGGGGTNRRQS